MAYLKPQSPIKYKEDHVYPLTSADQVILSDGSRLEQAGVVVAGKLSTARAISLTGDVTGTANFDGSNGVTIETSIASAAKHYTVSLKSSNWSASAPYTQTVTVNGIKAADNPIADIDMSTATTSNADALFEAWACIGRIATNTNSVIAYCYEEKPAVDISMNIIVIK